MESIEKRLVDSFDNEISRSTIESFKELHDIWDACGNSFDILGKLNDLHWSPRPDRSNHDASRPFIVYCLASKHDGSLIIHSINTDKTWHIDKQFTHNVTQSGATLTVIEFHPFYQEGNISELEYRFAYKMSRSQGFLCASYVLCCEPDYDFTTSEHDRIFSVSEPITLGVIYEEGVMNIPIP